MNESIKILGIVDNINVCAACGKKNLKKTICIEENGNINYYGCYCVYFILLGENRDKRKVKKSVAKSAIIKHLEHNKQLAINYFYKKNKHLNYDDVDSCVNIIIDVYDKKIIDIMRNL